MDAQGQKHPAQSQYRQAHDVEEVAVDLLHQQRAPALNAVGAGLVHGFAGADIGPQLLLRGRTEKDFRLLRLGVRIVAPADGNAGADGVTPSLKRGEHLQGMGLVPGLAQPGAVQKHHGVGGDDDLVRAAQSRGGPGLLPGDVFHRFPGAEVGGIGFLRLRHPDVKVRNAHPRQQLPAAGRAGGQYNLCH